MRKPIPSHGNAIFSVICFILSLAIIIYAYINNIDVYTSFPEAIYSIVASILFFLWSFDYSLIEKYRKSSRPCEARDDRQ